MLMLLVHLKIMLYSFLNFVWKWEHKEIMSTLTSAFHCNLYERLLYRTLKDGARGDRLLSCMSALFLPILAFSPLQGTELCITICPKKHLVFHL